MLLSLPFRAGKRDLFTFIPRSVQTVFLSMAASNDESNRGNLADGEVEQIVTMEKVVAADNKGIDYDKLISKLVSLSFSCSCFFFFCLLLSECDHK